jgi:V8-like Glu-specific endopeptidase
MVNNSTLGTGVLVSDKYILTCSHVIGDKENITVKFDFLKNKPEKNATVIFKQEDNYDLTGSNIDIALLKINNLPENINTYPLISIEEKNTNLEAFGYDYSAGRWVDFIHRGKNAYGWEQISVTKQDLNIEDGFSGAAAWEPTKNGIIGIIVASSAKNNSLNAYLMPTSTILQIKEIDKVIGKYFISQNPYKGLASFESQDRKYFFGREGDIVNPEFKSKVQFFHLKNHT